MNSTKSKLIVLSGALVVALVVVVHGQGAALPPATAPAATKEAQWNTLWDYWNVGGICMWPIGLCSIAAVALSIYGGMQYRMSKMIRPDLLQPLQESLGKLDVTGVVSICNGAPSILTNILAAGLKRIGEDGTVDVASMEKAMEEASIEEVNEGMKALNYLSVVSQVAPMLGLLGTVTGMIGAFNKIGMGGMGDPEKLASDIGEAMITTAFGLMVAIPAMFAYFGLKAQYISNVSRISRVLGDMIHHFAESFRKAGQSPAAGGATML